MIDSDHLPAEQIKSCCAALYDADWARLLLGESFHPGGLRLTERLGELLGLQPCDRVLDVAAGRGASAIHLAGRFGCQVTGVDFGGGNVARATEAAARAGFADRVRFVEGDAERLGFDSDTYDAVICECAFCTFPDKHAAAGEFARVLRHGGRVGLSDLTRRGRLPSQLDGLLAWIACVADARPVEDYVSCLSGAGVAVSLVEAHDDALGEMIEGIRAKLLGAELLVKLRQLDLPGVDFDHAKLLARSAAEAVRAGQLGYTLILGTRAGATWPAVGHLPEPLAPPRAALPTEEVNGASRGQPEPEV